MSFDQNYPPPRDTYLVIFPYKFPTSSLIPSKLNLNHYNIVDDIDVYIDKFIVTYEYREFKGQRSDLCLGLHDQIKSVYTTNGRFFYSLHMHSCGAGQDMVMVELMADNMKSYHPIT